MPAARRERSPVKRRVSQIGLQPDKVHGEMRVGLKADPRGTEPYWFSSTISSIVCAARLQL